jgi:hypothetical protein
MFACAATIWVGYRIYVAGYSGINGKSETKQQNLLSFLKYYREVMGCTLETINGK